MKKKYRLFFVTNFFKKIEKTINLKKISFLYKY